MLIYLDTKDLISLEGEKTTGEITLQFRQLLADSGSKLVYSFVHIHELKKPLYGKGKSNVMGMLNYLESLPHCWMKTDVIADSELKNGFRLFTQKKSYLRIDPFATSYVDTMESLHPSIRARFRRKPLSEIVWEQYSEGLYLGLDPVAHQKRLSKIYEDIISKDRDIIKGIHNIHRATVELFYDKIIKELSEGRTRNHRELDSEDPLLKFAEYLCSNPAICPSYRLVFELLNIFARDTMTKPQPSDVIGDFNHIAVLPYVDVFTADKRIVHYLKAYDDTVANKLGGPKYFSKTLRNIDEVLEMLERVS